MIFILDTCRNRIDIKEHQVASIRSSGERTQIMQRERKAVPNLLPLDCPIYVHNRQCAAIKAAKEVVNNYFVLSSPGGFEHHSRTASKYKNKNYSIAHLAVNSSEISPNFHS